MHANLIGLHVAEGAGATADRLAAYAARLGGHVPDAAVASAQAAKQLGGAVTTQASVLAYADGFAVAALAAFACLVLVAAMRRGPPSPF